MGSSPRSRGWRSRSSKFAPPAPSPPVRRNHPSRVMADNPAGPDDPDRRQERTRGVSIMPAPALTGRRDERGRLDRLLEAVRAGESRVLVVDGEAGGGKAALLDHLAAKGSDCRVARAAGVQSEMEVAFAGLHQLLAPMLDRLERLPVPQLDALRTTFSMNPGP